MSERRREELIVERHRYGQLILYEVAGDELDRLDNETSAIGDDASICLFSLATAISFSIALATTEIDSLRTFAVFVIVTILGYASTVIFGIKWARDKKLRTNIIKRIKERVGPLGEDGKEIDIKELAALPAEEAQESDKGQR
jgi:hypothetical protein